RVAGPASAVNLGVPHPDDAISVVEIHRDVALVAEPPLRWKIVIPGRSRTEFGNDVEIGQRDGAIIARRPAKELLHLGERHAVFDLFDDRVGFRWTGGAGLAA